MIKLHHTFKGWDGCTVRIYNDNKGHFAKIDKINGYYVIGESDEYGIWKNGFQLSADTFQLARKLLETSILNYL